MISVEPAFSRDLCSRHHAGAGDRQMEKHTVGQSLSLDPEVTVLVPLLAQEKEDKIGDWPWVCSTWLCGWEGPGDFRGLVLWPVS